MDCFAKHIGGFLQILRFAGKLIVQFGALGGRLLGIARLRRCRSRQGNNHNERQERNKPRAETTSRCLNSDHDEFPTAKEQLNKRKDARFHQ